MNELWSKILEIIKGELGPQSYNSWFINTKIIKFEDQELTISVPSGFCKDWLEKHYMEFIKDILKRTINVDDNLKIEFEIEHQNIFPSTPSKSSTPPIPSKPKKETKKVEALLKNNEIILKSKYTFDNFVVGNSNRFAHAACLAVAQSPAKSYNPLFVYGGVGLGKTHLMRAIGNYIIQYNQQSKVNILYISSEKFTNELINSIRDDRTVAFR